MERLIRYGLYLLLSGGLFLGVMGCTTLHPEASGDHGASEIRIPVALILQNDGKSCATTSVAMAISYFLYGGSQSLDKETVWKLSQSNESTVTRFGNDVGGLKRIALHYGFECDFLQNMSLSNLEFYLGKKIPVVLFIQLDSTGTRTHAVLATGYDRSAGLVYINDPAGQSTILAYGFLKKNWRAWLSNPRMEAVGGGFVVYPRKGMQTSLEDL